MKKLKILNRLRPSKFINLRSKDFLIQYCAQSFQIYYNQSNQKAMQVCFIIDNPKSMQQLSCINIPLIDYAKGGIEVALRNLSRNNFPGQNDILHLYKTSSPYQAVSSYQHNYLHFNFQLKIIQPAFPTNPAETIKEAFRNLGKYRILTPSQTLLGYRQGDIYDPCLFFFLTDRMTKRQINAMLQQLKNKKFFLRSQYHFVLLRICPPALLQKSINTLDSFKRQIESQQQTLLLKKFIQQINGQMKFLYNLDQITEAICSIVQNFHSNLKIDLEIKDLPLFGNFLTKANSRHLAGKKIKLAMFPYRKKRSIIPLPYKVQFDDSGPNVIIEKIYYFDYYADLNKNWNSNMQILGPFQRYKFLTSQHLLVLDRQTRKQQIYPVYYQQSTQTILIGLMKVGTQQGSYIDFYFPNFPYFQNILKNLHQKVNIQTIDNLIMNYLSNIPQFYWKFLYRFFTVNYNIKLSQNTLNATMNTRNQNAQNKLQSMRAMQRKNVLAQLQKSAQDHMLNKSQCCSIHSEKYNYYSKIGAKNQQNKKIVHNVFKSMLENLLTMNSKIGIHGYVQTGKASTPITLQLQKYSIKSKGEDFNQNISSGFGNPFKKRKKDYENSIKLEPLKFADEKNEENNKGKKQDDDKGQDLATKKMKRRKSSVREVEVQTTILTDINKIPLKLSKKLLFNPINYDAKLYQRNKEILQQIKQK